MNKLVKLYFLFMAAIGLAACQANTLNGSDDMNVAVANADVSQEFLDLFDYELQNRAFALNLMEAAVEKGEGDQALPFAKAYLALEKLNQRHFAPAAKAYNLDMKPRWWTRTRTSLAKLGTALMPETSLKTVHRVTVKYVEQLQRLEAISPARDKKFFGYVVAQEEAQAEAVGLVLVGNIDQAAMLLNNFVQQHQDHNFY
ncbi:hypothetical protein R50073_41020 [Maricurvus nonylphenolicus]|uniref:hypothetical protein n=1 Tax=Maricurvus nonylphenolicus TaxID=1008307 RepID=UPI0036F2BD07